MAKAGLFDDTTNPETDSTPRHWTAEQIAKWDAFNRVQTITIPAGKASTSVGRLLKGKGVTSQAQADAMWKLFEDEVARWKNTEVNVNNYTADEVDSRLDALFTGGQNAFLSWERAAPVDDGTLTPEEIKAQEDETARKDAEANAKQFTDYVAGLDQFKYNDSSQYQTNLNEQARYGMDQQRQGYGNVLAQRGTWDSGQRDMGQAQFGQMAGAQRAAIMNQDYQRQYGEHADYYNRAYNEGLNKYQVQGDYRMQAQNNYYNNLAMNTATGMQNYQNLSNYNQSGINAAMGIAGIGASALPGWKPV